MTGVRNFKAEHALLSALLAIGAVLYAILPSLGLQVFGSPDETAVFNVASRFAQGSTASVSEPLAVSYPWLHPRSWLSRGQTIAPVGFLGWPWILSWSASASPHFVTWFATLVILSSVIPVWFFLDRLPKGARFLSALVYLTFPVSILYANRSLFPNGAVLSLTLWVGWLLRNHAISSTLQGENKRGLWSLFAIGILTGLTLSIRPVEAFWLMPWWIYAGWPWGKRSVLLFAGGLFTALIPVLIHAQIVYGAFWKAGYTLRDNPPIIELAQLPVRSTAYRLPPTDYFLPYGFHPRAIFRNADSYLRRFLFPWFVLVVGAIIFRAFTLIKYKRWPGAEAWLAAWTFVFLLIIYGSGVFADHVRPGAVTLGNSFLRYMLPLAPLTAWSAGVWWQAASRRRVRFFVGGLLVALSAFGVYQGLAGDDESVLALRRELVRYAEIRASAAAWFRSGDVIVSERSDKIFFPVYRGVSPLPPLPEIGRFTREQGESVGFFGRSLEQADKDAFLKEGIEPVELMAYGRERLYLLRPSISP